MPPLRWRLLILAVLSESAVAYRGGPSAFARSVSHRQPSLARFAARAPVPACAATPPPDAAKPERLPAAVLPITLTVFAQMIGEGLALTSLPLHMKSLGASPCQEPRHHLQAFAESPSSCDTPGHRQIRLRATSSLGHSADSLPAGLLFHI